MPPLKKKWRQPVVATPVAASAVINPEVSPVDEQILTPAQLAERLQVSPSTVYEFTRKRQNGREPLKALRAGKFLRFRWSDVIRWMERTA
jgi:excisionase family DNA binding protein